jgi:hypothetical protein
MWFLGFANFIGKYINSFIISKVNLKIGCGIRP